MGDLARAIVDLGRAAEGRRSARRELGESVTIVVRAITAQLRVGDAVKVDSLSADDPAVLVPTVDYAVAKVRFRGEKGVDEANVLMRGNAVLDLIEAKGSITRIPASTYAYPATVEDRLAFLGEAEDVVNKFRALLESQAETYQEAAARATKLVIR